MKHQEGLVSIVLPVCNSAKFLKEALYSLASQSYKQIEVIAVDDFSRDESYKILSKFSKKDKRVRVYRNVKRYGPVVSFNRAFRRARGQFIAFMHPHDKVTKHRIAKQLKFLSANPKVAAVGTQCVFINDQDRQVDKSGFPAEHQSIVAKLLSGASVQFETLMINRKMLPKDILNFTHNVSSVRYTDFLMKILSYGEVANLPEFLHFRRAIPRQTMQHLQLLPSLARLFLKGFTEYDVRTSLRSLVFPLLKQA